MNENHGYSELTYSKLALALASDYESIYYLDTEDNSYVEYSGKSGKDMLCALSSGEDFFKDMDINCRRLVYEEDQKRFLETMRRENMLEALKNNNAFTLGYRLVINGDPQYFDLKTIKDTASDDRFVIIGVRNVDEQMRREKAAAEESEIYSQISMALASRYEVIYYIDLVRNNYIVYSSSDDYSKLGVSKEGYDFFETAKKDIRAIIHPEDRDMLLGEIERDNFLSKLDINGTLTLTYRQKLGDRIKYVSMNAIRPKNDDSHVVIGVVNIDAQKRREKAFTQALGNAMDIANHDALTSVKNKHAYTAAENEINKKIADGSMNSFAVGVFDVNGLKEINDTKGHLAGDEYIKSACRLICSVFKHSPVFRIGGDEFAAIISGDDLKSCGKLIGRIKDTLSENAEKGLVTFALGVSYFAPESDTCMGDVFLRADTAMYENKRKFKEGDSDVF